MKALKQSLSLLLALAMAASLSAYSAPPAEAVTGESQGWFYIDPLGGVSLTGEVARDYMGGMEDVLLELTGQEKESSAWSPPLLRALPSEPLDMSVYDVLGFGSKTEYADIGNSHVFSDPIKIAECMMYRIMSNEGWTPAILASKGAYYLTYKPGTLVTNDSKGAKAINKTLEEVWRYIVSYFPHYFAMYGNYGSSAGTFVDRVTFVISYSNIYANPTHPYYYWQEEYDKVTELLDSNNLGSVFCDGRTAINTGTDADKMKNAHDYICKTVSYCSDEGPGGHNGQYAYCALLEHTPVCNGYTLAYSMLCLRMGLNMPYVNGSVGGGGHAWNLNLTEYPDIRLIDTTWDDSPGTAGGVVYSYYNLSLTDPAVKNRKLSAGYLDYLKYVNDNSTASHKISGTVRDNNGVGIPAVVQLKNSSGGNVRSPVTAAANGAFTIGYVPDGTYTVTASLKGYKASGAFPSVTVSGADVVTGISITLQQMTDADYEAARDATWSQITASTPFAVPFPSGVAEYSDNCDIEISAVEAALAAFPGLPEDMEFTVTAYVPDGDGGANCALALTIRTVAGKALTRNIANFTVRLDDTPAVITGMVTSSAAGEPVSGASVVWKRIDDAKTVTDTKKVTADANGVYTIVGTEYRPGTSNILEISAPGYADLTVPAFTIPGHLVKLVKDISLQRKGQVTTDGTVGLGQGAPLTGHINLLEESISIPFWVAAYSVDGGKKWKAGPLPEGKKLSALFNKGMTLMVTNVYNPKTVKDKKVVVSQKGPADDADIIKFPPVEKRPRANAEKLKPSYGEVYWVPLVRGTEDPVQTYQYSPSSNGKTPDGSFLELPEDGFEIKPNGTKETYMFQSLPVADGSQYTPAGKVFKIKPKARAKAPKVEPNERKGILKLKKDYWYQEKGADDAVLCTTPTELKIVASPSGDNQLRGGAALTVWAAATGKKPPSERQELTLPLAPSPGTG